MRYVGDGFGILVPTRTATVTLVSVRLVRLASVRALNLEGCKRNDCRSVQAFGIAPVDGVG